MQVNNVNVHLKKEFCITKKGHAKMKGKKNMYIHNPFHRNKIQKISFCDLSEYPFHSQNIF